MREVDQETGKDLNPPKPPEEKKSAKSKKCMMDEDVDLDGVRNPDRPLTDGKGSSGMFGSRRDPGFVDDIDFGPKR